VLYLAGALMQALIAKSPARPGASPDHSAVM